MCSKYDVEPRVQYTLCTSVEKVKKGKNSLETFCGSLTSRWDIAEKHDCLEILYFRCIRFDNRLTLELDTSFERQWRRRMFELYFSMILFGEYTLKYMSKIQETKNADVDS